MNDTSLLKPRVLHVDDDINFLELFRVLFNNYFEIHSSESGIEAIEIVKKEEYDLLVTDYDMPDFDGLDVLKAVKKIKPNLPVILETGQGNEEVAREAFILGASDYFVKDYFGFAHKEKFINSVNMAVEIKRATEERLKTERKFRLLYERAAEGIFICSYNRIILSNPAFQKITGYNEEQLTSVDFGSLIHPDDKEMVLNRQKNRLESMDVTNDYDFRIITSENRVKWLKLNASLIDWDNEKVTLNFVSDITGRKSMEESLREERDRSRQYLDIAGVMFVALDLKGNVTLINKKGCEILGFSEGEVLGKNWIDHFIPEENRQETRELFAIMTLEEIPKIDYFENEILTKNNDIRIVAWHNTLLRDKKGNVTGSLSSGEDITLRKQHEKEQNRLIRLIENSRDFTGVATLDGDVIYLNPVGLEMSGLNSLNEARSRKISDFVPYENAERLMESIIPRVFEKGFDTGEGLLKNLHTRQNSHIEYNVFLIKSPENGEPLNIAVIIKDITERKKAKEALIESEANLKSIFRAAPVGIGLVDRKRIITKVNNCFCQMIGYSREEIVGRNAAFLYPDLAEYNRVGKEKYRQILKKGVGTVETRFKHKNGKIIDVLLSSTPVDLFDMEKGVTFTAVDITERKKNARMIEESEKKYRLLVENMNELVVKSNRNKEITYISPNCKKILGKSEKKLLGENFSQHIYKEDIPSVEKSLKDLMIPPYSSYNEERIKTKAGYKWYGWSGKAILGEDGNITEFIGVGRDITARHRYEEAIESLLVSGASQLGEKFFEEMSLGLSRILGADFTMIGEICDEDKKLIKTISFCSDLKIQDNFYYDISGSPCEKIIKNNFCSFTSGVIDKFPNSKMLNSYQIDGFVGVPLFDKKGQHLGVMTAMFRKPVKNIGFVESVMKLFANRVAAELERKRIEGIYRSIVENSLQAIGIVQDSSLIYANPKLCEITGYSKKELLSLGNLGFINMIYPADQEKVIMNMKERFRGGNTENNYLIRVVNKNREIRWVETLASLIEYRGRPAIQFAQLDVTDRKRAEEQTRVFKTITETANYGVAISDYKGRLIYVNDYMARVHGYKIRELIGENFSMFYNREQFDTFNSLLKSVKINGSLPPTEIWHTSKDEKTFPMLLAGMLISSREGINPFIAITAMDISEIKKAESALRESEAKYRSLAENTPDIIIRLNKEHRYVFINQSVKKIMNVEPEYIIGKTHKDLHSKNQYAAKFDNLIEKVFKTGKPQETEITHPGKEGEIIFNWRLFPEYNRNNEIANVLGIAKDITQQRKTERKFQLLFDEMVSGISIGKIICNKEGKPVDFKILTVNPAYEKLTGRSAEDVIGKNILEINPDTEKHLIDIFGKVALTGEPVQFENYFKSIGKYFQTAAFQTAPGEFACSFQDVTERKKAEEKILKSLKEKEILLSEIHHRVKNNLQIIISLLGMQLDSISEEKSVMALKESINRVRSMAYIHQKLYKSEDPSTVDLRGYVQKLVNDLVLTYVLHKEKPEIKMNVDDILLEIDTAIPCGLILNELISNSLKHAFNDGKAGKINVSMKSIDDGKIVLIVSDNGVGIDKNVNIKKLKSLGLRLVHLLVDQLQGEIEVVRGKGIKFKITFNKNQD